MRTILTGKMSKLMGCIIESPIKMPERAEYKGCLAMNNILNNVPKRSPEGRINDCFLNPTTMPQVTYLLVQEKTPTTYKILRPQISDDIPNTSKIQLLLDQAAVAVCSLVDPALEPD